MLYISGQQAMTKNEAIALLGGTKSAAARAMNITRQALNGWPDGPLSAKRQDRVEAALFRKVLGRQPTPSESPEREAVAG
jgi:hypothetical protein